MVHIDNTLVSFDLFKEQFICDLPNCLGACCVEGDFGAPLEQEEVKVVADNLEKIKPYMTAAGLELLKKDGFHETDPDGDLVTTCVNGRDCVFVYHEKSIYSCAIEKAFLNNEIDFRKPISCHLYPVRLGKVKEMVSVSYNEWHICSPARVLGKQEGVPLYVFLKDALIRRFGISWYTQMDEIADDILEMDT
ncbi:MAG: DUF3109 family protein [Bacteroidetes bacterium]|jgi:hypothetical protein|nr:DUF3109 family protein [Bacteroidota bacterium]MBT3422098.1 DUF3109 family protein [Bacteroidota bacterium]MBT3800230.1 DUF3109 family protein [Bacteroidota bacterium]MBT3935921.1 DUF3109 family protein [Bacteroidota bacterium]MBT4339635.1 DUF3109 family protein [Bacteroidota bacterium]